jgi:surfactin synthase thioesterase subunit
MHYNEQKVLAMLNPWISFSIKAWQLGFEAQSVIALRMMRMAAGGARADAEASRMLCEKIVAAREAQLAATTAVMQGHKDHVVAGKALAVYSKHVNANKRRLSRR